MIEQRVTKRYVRGFIRVAQAQKCVVEAGDCLKNLDKLLRTSPEVSALLYHPGIPREKKKKLIGELLETAAPPVVRVFMDFIIQKKREKILPYLYAEYRAAADELQGVVRVSVTSAVEFAGAQRDKLTAILEEKLGSTVVCAFIKDSAIMGGLRIVMGSNIIDATVSGRLEQLHRYLLSGPGRAKKAA